MRNIDDTTLIVSGSSADEIADQINNTLQLITSWTHSNRLKLNLNKTKFSLFTNHKDLSLDRIMIDGIPIDRCSQYKILGLILDENLTFGSHINQINRKIAYCAHAVSRLDGSISTSVKKTLYYAYAEPHIRYAIEIYGNTHKKYIKN